MNCPVLYLFELYYLFFRFVNPSEDNKPAVQNLFNVPEVESPMLKRIKTKSSTPKKNVTAQDKKTVQIHTLPTKNQKSRSVGNLLTVYLIEVAF